MLKLNFQTTWDGTSSFWFIVLNRMWVFLPFRFRSDISAWVQKVVVELGSTPLVRCCLLLLSLALGQWKETKWQPQYDHMTKLMLPVLHLRAFVALWPFGLDSECVRHLGETVCTQPKHKPLPFKKFNLFVWFTSMTFLHDYNACLPLQNGQSWSGVFSLGATVTSVAKLLPVDLEICDLITDRGFAGTVPLTANEDDQKLGQIFNKRN